MSSEKAVRDQATMEGRCRGAPRRVTVVYYLCRHERHLEHPHLMELTLASPDHALYLRDVIHRLDALRGKGMAAMYSWSCKRRYKTGFVWHDVSEDDVLLPAQGSGEYVLKGSLLPLRHSPIPTDQQQQCIDATTVPKVQCVKPVAQDASPAPSQGSEQAGWMANGSSPPPPPPLQPMQQPDQGLSSVSPSSSTSKDTDQEEARSSSSGSSSSPHKSMKRGSGGNTPSSSSSGCSPSPPCSLTPTKDHKPLQSSNITAQDTSEQTDGVASEKKLHRTKDASGGRSRTLESMIRAEALVRRGGCGATSTRILLEDDECSLDGDKEAVHSLGARLKPANLLMRLVACGSASTMSMRHHSACGFMRTTHKPQHLSHHLEPPPSSPVLSPLGALIMRPEATGIRAVSESGSGNCSCRWSMPETVAKGDESSKGMPTSSYDPNRVSEKQTSNKGNSENLECGSRTVPHIIRMAPSEQPASETLVTITTDARHNNPDHDQCGNEPSFTTLSRSMSMRDPSAAKTRSPKIVSFHDEKQKVVKIEQRFGSGGRVVIQCAPLLKENYVRAKAM
ncbi:hypothetical protein QOZ80_6BG0478660 [Eleusine coracana subsp. coracana]|nr:hypothetical protein QOZ80_6BG0478660 [Eleusine coracana subsp. coracana]